MPLNTSSDESRRDPDVLESLVSRHYLLIAGAILLLASVLRAHNLGGTSLWLDEATFANNARHPIGEMLEWTRHRSSSPIFLPLVYWLFGDAMRDATAARVLPMLFGTGSVIMLLALPRVGVPALAAALAALVLAINPHEIEYSQEVREYSLSGLATCAVMFVSLWRLRRPTRGTLAALCAVMFAVPFAAYGTIFMALALLGTSTLLDLAVSRQVRFSLILPWGFLAGAIVLSWLLTARYEFGGVSASYLDAFYPPEGLLASMKWTAKSLGAYAVYGSGSAWLAPIAGCMLVAAVCLLLMGVVVQPGLRLLLGGLVLLVAGSLCAAFLGLYPFGALRNHVFAVPLIALSTAWSAYCIAALLRRSRATMFIGAFAVLFAAAPIRELPGVYAERQDIVSAVDIGLRGVPDNTVFAYHAAYAALEFHFPDREFALGSYIQNDAEAIAREANTQVGGCTIHMLFSHVYRGFDDEIVAMLVKGGAVLVRDQRFVGARVATLSRCAEESF